MYHSPDHRNGLRRYSSPFTFTSYRRFSNRPNSPSGKPFFANHMTYCSGRSMSRRPLYLPKGIRVFAIFNNTSGSGVTSSILLSMNQRIEIIFQLSRAGLNHQGFFYSILIWSGLFCRFLFRSFYFRYHNTSLKKHKPHLSK